jgi:simple sugar transport system permease protein
MYAALRSALARSSALLLALAIGAVLILVTGNSPIAGAAALWEGAFGSATATAGTFALATPLMLSALGFAVAFQGGMFNAGTEGQIVIGAFTGALAGFGISGLPAFIHVPVALASGALGGALWALLPGFWRLWWGANEIVTTLMMNFIAVLLNDYLVLYPFRDPSREAGTNVQTPSVLESARLPSIWPPHRVSIGLLLTLAIAAGLWFFMQRTLIGYEIRMTGTAARAAENAGIPARRRMLQSMLGSGAVAGLAGAVQVLGVFFADISPFTVGLGFTGVVISLLVNNRSLLIPPAALFFAALQSGALGMELRTSISRYLVGAVVAIVVLLVTARTGQFSRLKVLLTQGALPPRQQTD